MGVPVTGGGSWTRDASEGGSLVNFVWLDMLSNLPNICKTSNQQSLRFSNDQHFATFSSLVLSFANYLTTNLVHD